MAREEIRIDLEANDDASRRIDDVADAVEDLEDERVAIPITADPDQAIAALDRVTEKAQQTERAVADVGTKGATPAANAIADLTGPLGDASTAASDFGGALEGAGDLAAGLGEKLGLSAERASALGSFVGGPLALGVAAVAAGIELWAARERKAKEEAERIRGVNREIAEALAEGELHDAAQQLVDEYGDLYDAARRAGVPVADLTRFLTGQGDTLGDLSGRYDSLTRQQREFVDDTVAASTHVRGQITAYGDQAIAIDEVAAALGGATSATAALEAAYSELDDTLSDRSSYLGAAQAIDDIAGAQRDAAAAAAEYGAGSEEARRANRDLEQQMIDAQQGVLDYAESIGGIPPERLTEIQALIDQGALAAAQFQLDLLEQERKVKVSVDPTNFNSWVQRNLPHGWGGGFSVGPSTNVTIHATAGQTGDQILAAADRYVRRNGGRTLTRGAGRRH